MQVIKFLKRNFSSFVRITFNPKNKAPKMKTSTVVIEKISSHQNSDGLSNQTWVLNFSRKDSLFITFYIASGYTWWNLYI